MTDEYLRGIINVERPQDAEVEVHYSYTPAEEAQRAAIIAQIEAEKAAYLARVEPLMQKLGAIRGRTVVIIKSRLR